MAIDSASSASLAPGFRFHPTDEELVWYYLRRKICGKPFRVDAISDVDIYKVEPWDLPGRSRLKTRDLEWYFFSALDKKYGNGSRTNRATDRGYWKTTGKDRPVYHRTQLVGMKKTLVYHSGRAPRGERTNWVMHEYRLIDEELEKAGILQDSFVLCRIFRKSGSGPKNGEQYGAPFIEEEWEDDELAMVPKQESAEEVTVDDDDAYLDANDIEQILGADTPAEVQPLPPSFCCGDDGNGVEVSTDVIEDPQVFLAGMSENQPGAEQTQNPMLFDLPVQNEMDATAVKREYIGEASNDANSVELDYLRDQPFFDASNNPSLEDGSFLEANDLDNAVEADPGSDMLEEYLTYFDATTDNLPYTFDFSIASEDLISDSAHEYLNEGNQLWNSECKPSLGESSKDAASSSNQAPALFGSDTKYPFLQQATRMLGNIPAPPAFASEFPSKEAALHLAAASHSSKAIHVTAGMIRIRNVTLSGNGLDMSFGKHGQVNIVLSFDLGDSQQVDKVNSATNSAVSRSWLYSILFIILVLSMSFKLGSLFCARSFMS